MNSRNNSIIQGTRHNRDIHLNLADHFLQSYDGRTAITKAERIPPLPKTIIDLWNVFVRRSIADYYVGLRDAMKVKIRLSTLFRTFELLDRVLIQRNESQDCSLIMTVASSGAATHEIDEDELRLLVGTCFLIASKKEDVYHISMKELRKSAMSSRFSVGRILGCEEDTLKRLEFDLCRPLPNQIAEYFISIYFKSLGSGYATQLLLRARYTLFLSLYRAEFSALQAHQRAAVAIITAIKLFDVMGGRTLYEECNQVCQTLLYAKRRRNASSVVQDHPPCGFFHVLRKEDEMLGQFIKNEEKMFRSFKLGVHYQLLKSEFKLSMKSKKSFLTFRKLTKKEYPSLKKSVLEKFHKLEKAGISRES